MDFHKPLILRYVGHSDAVLAASDSAVGVIPGNLWVGCHPLFIFPPECLPLTGAEQDTIVMLSILLEIARGRMSTTDVGRYLGRTDRTIGRRRQQLFQRGFTCYPAGRNWPIDFTPFEEKFAEMLLKVEEPAAVCPFVRAFSQMMPELAGLAGGPHAWVRARDYVQFRYFLPKVT